MHRDTVTDPFAHVDYDQRDVQHEELPLPPTRNVPSHRAPRLTRGQVRAVVAAVAARHGAQVDEQADRFVVTAAVGHVVVAPRSEVTIHGAMQLGWDLRSALKDALKAPPPQTQRSADVDREVPAEVAAIVTRAIRAISPAGWRWRVWNDFHGMCSPITGRVIVEVDDLGGFSVDLRSLRVSVAWGLTRAERRAYGSAPAGVQAVRDAVNSALNSRRAA